MAGRGWRGVKILGGLLAAVLLAGGTLAWMERANLRTWYYLRGLARAGAAERETWVVRVAGLGEMAVPGLLDLLADADAHVSANARAALARLADDWGLADPRTTDLVQQLGPAFANLPPAGQQNVLELVLSWFTAAPREAASTLTSACARLVGEAASSDVEVQAAGLELCAALLARAPAGEALAEGRALVRACLRAERPALKLRAIQLALFPGMALLQDVVVLLNDPAAKVRRAAVRALGPAQEVVQDDGLLPSLHDPDPEVRRLCKEALLGRKLLPEHIELGWLLTHPNPVERLKVLDRLHSTPNVDPGLWLRRLSHDASPAVRVAALRVMSLQTYVDLTDRIDQMMQSDPSPTVCSLARYYRTCARISRSLVEER
jgi:hypothetical protein